MSDIEETLERIKGQPGVEGYVICNRDGVLLRRMPSMSEQEAEKYALYLKRLAMKTRHLVRDLKPVDELKNLRIRTKKNKELVVAHDNDFIVIVIQQWNSYIPS